MAILIPFIAVAGMASAPPRVLSLGANASQPTPMISVSRAGANSGTDRLMKLYSLSAAAAIGSVGGSEEAFFYPGLPYSSSPAMDFSAGPPSQTVIGTVPGKPGLFSEVATLSDSDTFLNASGSQFTAYNDVDLTITPQITSGSFQANLKHQTPVWTLTETIIAKVIPPNETLLFTDIYTFDDTDTNVILQDVEQVSDCIVEETGPITKK